MAIVAIVNAKDVFGLCISGVRDGDTYEHIAASGQASFAKEVKNQGVAGWISVVAVGANIAAAAFGVPEVAPLINAAAAAAKQQFRESPEEEAKQRDVYGFDTNNGGRAQQEGGLLVCEPVAQGVYGSGDGKVRWIGGNGDRTNEKNYPAHILGQAFFPQRGMARRRLRGTGDMFIRAWDFAFDDNAGFYEIHFILRRGPGRDTPPVG